MDFGEALLRKSGTNYLRQATCAISKRASRSNVEITWTDGIAVFMSKVDIAQKAVVTTEQIIRKDSLGNKSSILGTTWSCENECKQGRYLAIFSADCISLWLRKNRNHLKTREELLLVKEIAVENCCAQGFQWHPQPPERCFAFICRNRAIVCRIDEKVSGGEEKIAKNCFVTVFYSKAKLEHLQSCSWSHDGHRLLISVGRKLLLFFWPDLSDLNTYVTSLLDSLDTHGNISCIAALGESSFVAATELPLDRLCNSKIDKDLFQMPDLSNGSELPQEKNQMKDFITKRTSCKEEHSLFNLNCQSTEHHHPMHSQLMLIDCKEDKPKKLCCKMISGLMTPDLLLVDPFLQLIVVGSNTSSELQIFSLLRGNSDLSYLNTIKLALDNRPKGLCKLPGQTGRFLLMQGKLKVKNVENTLPTASFFDQYKTSLEIFDFKQFLPCEIETKSSLVNSKRHGNDCFNGEIEAKKEIESLHLPGGKVFKPHQVSNKPLVEEMSTVSSTVPQRNDDPENDIAFLTKMKEDILTELRKLDARIESLAASNIPSQCLSKEKFPSVDQAEFVTLHFTHSVTKKETSEQFLLENGKLNLKTIRETFRVNIVKLVIGDKTCIISQDPKGYIPLQFVSGSAVEITGC